KNSSPSSTWKSFRALGPPTAMTMNSESCQIILLPTGGLSSARCSSIQRVRLMGGARGIVTLLVSGGIETASTVNSQQSTGTTPSAMIVALGAGTVDC